MTEREWVDSFIPALGERLTVVALKGSTLAVEAGKKLPYAFEVLEYNAAEPSKRHINRYETDILVYDRSADEKWILRVIIECKLGSVTTHDQNYAEVRLGYAGCLDHRNDWVKGKLLHRFQAPTNGGFAVQTRMKADHW